MGIGNDKAWDSDTGSLGNLDVDVEHLGNISTYINELVHAIRHDLQPYLVQVNQLLTVGSNETQSTLGSPQIPEVGGGQDPNTGLAPKIRATYTAVYQGLKGTADSLEQSATAVKKIAENYKTADDRNARTAADFIAAAQSGEGS